MPNTLSQPVSEASRGRSGERVLLALLVGTHWTIAWIVPFLFKHLDKPQAATLNAKLFDAEAIICLFIVALLFLLSALRLKAMFLRSWRTLILSILGVIAAFCLWYVYPAMLAAGAGTPTFDNMHRLSSSLYLVTGFLGLALVAFQD